MENLQQIGSKFLFGRVCSCVENHDFATVLFDQVSNDFTAESSESIPMGAHNSAFITAQDAFQYPLESFAFEVDATAEGLDDLCFWESLPHPLNLRGEVVRLRFTADSAVAKGSRIWFALFIDELLNIVNIYLPFTGG